MRGEVRERREGEGKVRGEGGERRREGEGREGRGEKER